MINTIESNEISKNRAQGSNKRKETKKYVRERVSFTAVDDIMDDIIDEKLHSVLFSITNLSMVFVMAVSAYLWFKLNKVDH